MCPKFQSIVTLAATGIMFCISPATSDAQDVAAGPYRDLVGQTAPELIAGENAWMNLDDPLTLESLRGRAVWLEFSFIKCGGCLMMKPILHGLQHEYESKGLVVIEVNNGAIDTREELAQEVERRRPGYPVLWDADGRTCETYGVRRYATAYLIGADGNVIWNGDPIGLTVLDMWKMIHGALRDVDLDAVRDSGDIVLAGDLTATDRRAEGAPAGSPTEESRYDLGWHFTIRTSDNSMLIEGVRDGSPAALAGMRDGDTIVSINGLLLSEASFERLKSELHRIEKQPDPVTIGLNRNGTRLEFTITPQRVRERPSPP